MPSFSARGPSKIFRNILKPDIIAPGEFVLTASIPKMRALEIEFESLEGNYTVVSGTSFACPHVAGVAALLKSAHPKWSIAAIMTTADIWDNTQEPIRAHKKSTYEDASPLDMGAGHMFDL